MSDPIKDEAQRVASERLDEILGRAGVQVVVTSKEAAERTYRRAHITELGKNGQVIGSEKVELTWTVKLIEVDGIGRVKGEMIFLRRDMTEALSLVAVWMSREEGEGGAEGGQEDRSVTDA